MTQALGLTYRALAVGLLAAGTGCGAETALRASGLLSPPFDPATSHAIPRFEIPVAEPGVAYERFIAIGDVGTGGADQFEVAAALADRANREGLDFILTLGDNIYENGVASATDAQGETKFEEPYADPALDVPIYLTLGNHDHRGNTDAQIEYSERNPNWMMLARYYTFSRILDDGTDVQFFAIDTTPMHDAFTPASAQIAWLDQALVDSNARWNIVFGHHPLFSHSAHGSDRLLIDTLEPIFSSRGVDVYFAGHEREHGKTAEVLIVSADSAPIQAFRSACPEVATASSESELQAFFLATVLPLLGGCLSPAVAAQVPEFSGDILVVTDTFGDAVHDSHVMVHVWTVNETEDIRRFLELGVDGIISEFPDRVLALLDSPAS